MSRRRTFNCAALAVLQAMVCGGLVGLRADTAVAAEHAVAVAPTPTPTPTPLPAGATDARRTPRTTPTLRRSHGLIILGTASGRRSTASRSTRAAADVPVECFQNLKDKPTGPSVYSYDEAQTFYLGRGFDPYNPSLAFRDCLKKLDETHGNIRGAVYNMDVIETRAALYRTTGSDFTAAARANWVGGGFSADYSTSNLSGFGFAEDTLVLDYHGDVDLGLYQGSFVPDAQFAPLLDPSSPNYNPAKFAQSCGHRYVKNEKRVVRYDLLYEFSGINQSEKSELTQAAGASFNASSGTSDFEIAARARFRNAVDALSSRAQVKLRLSSRGGGRASLQLQAAIIRAGFFDPKALREALASFLENLGTEPEGVAVEFHIGEMTQFGLKYCFQQGIDTRDGALGSIQLEIEEAKSTINRLNSLALEVKYGLLAPANLPNPEGQVRALIAAFTDRITALEEDARTCAADEAADFRNCKVAQAADRPPIPVEIIELLYDKHDWTFHRWCTDYLANVPNGTPQQTSDKTVAAILPLLQEPSLRPNCLRAQKAIPDIRGKVSLAGQTAYDARVLRSLGGLTRLGIDGGGSFRCTYQNGSETVQGGTCVVDADCLTGTGSDGCPQAKNNEANAICQAQGVGILGIRALQDISELEELALRNVALDDTAVDDLLQVRRCIGGSKDGAACSIRSDCQDVEGTCEAPRECVGGSRAGQFCRVNSDCVDQGATCVDQPKVCVGGAYPGKSCAGGSDVNCYSLGECVSQSNASPWPALQRLDLTGNKLGS